MQRSNLLYNNPKIVSTKKESILYSLFFRSILYAKLAKTSFIYPSIWASSVLFTQIKFVKKYFILIFFAIDVYNLLSFR